MKSKFISWLALLFVLAVVPGSGKAQETKAPAGRSPLKILFVGYDPARKPAEFRKGLDEFAARDSIRMPAFRNLLSRYFSQVQTMDCRDWKPEDSGPYDVTVFDYKTTAMEKRSEKAAPRYLPDNYSRPVVFIGSTAAQMGERIGLKLDWLCLCLNSDAHHINTGHPVFRGPLENVVPTLEMKPTPENIYEYPSGDTVPRTIPMWKVQNLKYQTDESARIGLVSRGSRFQDSPDAEVISSGVCAKDVTAVALGRHGNFFLWGFSASPADMTEEAQKVFVNVVAYMKQFDGQLPIARKYNDRMATTDYVKDDIAWCTRECWQRAVADIEKFNKETQVQLKKLTDKKASGAVLSENEKEMLNIYSQARPSPAPIWEEYLKQRMGPLAARFGTDAEAFRRYLLDNMNYVWCDPKGFYSYQVDEDVRKLKISNHSPALLEKCIGMLKARQDTGLAMRVLRRYTAERFRTAAEWNTWYLRNKDRLFFTETGGYKFLVNTLAGGAAAVKAGGAGSGMAAGAAFDQKLSTGIRDLVCPRPDEREPVRTIAALVRDPASGQLAVVIKAQLAAGWHIYSYVPSEFPYITTQCLLELPPGVRTAGDWEKTPPVPSASDRGVLIWEKEAVFVRRLIADKRSLAGAIRTGLSFQTCDMRQCLPPAEKWFDLKL